MTRGAKMVKSMLLRTCSSLIMLSRITFITVSSRPELVNKPGIILSPTNQMVILKGGKSHRLAVW